MICGEADQHGFVSKSLANQLADVHLTVMTHLGGARVAQVGIMRPDNRFRLPASIKMRNQIADRVHHVPVAQVPRRRAAAKHRTVVLLRVFYQPRILFCKKKSSSAATSPSRLKNSAAFCCNSTSWATTASSQDSIAPT